MNSVATRVMIRWLIVQGTVLSAVAGPAYALPKYAEQEAKPCEYCHVPNSRTGANERNYRGRFYREHNYSFAGFDDLTEAKKAGEPVGPAPDPPPRSYTPPVRLAGKPGAAKPEGSPMLPVSVAAAKVEAARQAYQTTHRPAAQKAYAAALATLADAILGSDNPSSSVEEKHAAARRLYRRARVLDPKNPRFLAATLETERILRGAAPPRTAGGSNPAATPREETAPEQEVPVDGEQVLRTLAERWQAAATLEYRSVAVMDHQGETRVEVRVHARLRRPNQARLIFVDANKNKPEASRTRVCDGRIIYDRQVGAGYTFRAAFQGSITQYMVHPLDGFGLAYTVEQFFSPTPFLPPPPWGDADEGRPTITAIRTTRAVNGRQVPVFRVVLTSGVFKDTLTVDATNYAPLNLTRFGIVHGQAQTILTETFSDVHLGPLFNPALLTWTVADEAGR